MITITITVIKNDYCVQYQYSEDNTPPNKAKSNPARTVLYTDNKNHIFNQYR